MTADNIEQLSTFFSRTKADNISAHWQYYRNKHHAYCKNLRPLFMALEFNYAKECQALKTAVNTLKTLFNNGTLLSQYPKLKLPKHFIPKSLRDILVVNNTIDVYQYKALVYQQLADKIHKGKVTCDDLTQYRDFDREIKEAVNGDDVEERETLIKELDIEELSIPIETLLEGFETEINTLYEEANVAIVSGDNPHLKYTKTDAGYDWNRRYTRIKDAFNNP